MEEYVYTGLGLEVTALENDEVTFMAAVVDGNQQICTKDEAIAAARAILKHFQMGVE